MMPLRTDYVAFPVCLLAGIALLAKAEGERQVWALPIVAVVLLVLFHRAWRAFGRDRRFAAGGWRGSRRYPVQVRVRADGYLPVTGTGRCLIQFAGRHGLLDPRVIADENEIHLFVEDAAGKMVPETVGEPDATRPMVVRERAFLTRENDVNRAAGELYVPADGPWVFLIRFHLRTGREGLFPKSLDVRAWGRCADLQWPDGPVLEDGGPHGFPVIPLG